MANWYEFPEIWPRGVNPQPGDFAARELAKAGKTIVNVGQEESSRYVTNFRSTTGIRSDREHTVLAAGESVFWKMVDICPEYLGAGYDNVVLGCLYEALYREPFAPHSAGVALGGSLTIAELRRALSQVRDASLLDSIRRSFRQSDQNIFRLAKSEGIELRIPPVLREANTRH